MLRSSAGRRNRGDLTALSWVLSYALVAMAATLCEVLTSDCGMLDHEQQFFDGLSHCGSVSQMLQWSGAALRAFVAPCWVELEVLSARWLFERENLEKM
jgi:hypothetical protein